MKNIKILIILVFFNIFSAKSQTIYEILQNDSLNYFQKTTQIESIKEDASKDLVSIDSSVLKRYDRYVTFWDSRIDETGSPSTFINETKSYFIEPTSDISVNWDNIGPRFVTVGSINPVHYQGRAQAIEAVIKGSDTIIYVGAANGGLWKSTDGGVTYQHKTPNIFGGVYKIAVHPTRKDTLFIACGMYANGLLNYGKYGAGVFKSYDGGENWNEIYPCTPSDMTYFQDIIIDPNTPSTIYAITRDKVMKSTDLGASWGFMSVENSDKSFYEIDINPQNSNQMFVSGDGLIRWNNSNQIWEDISENLFSSDTILESKLGVSVYNNEFYILMYYKDITNTKRNIFVKTSDYGNNFVYLSEQLLSAYNYVLHFEISPNGTFYGGGINMFRAFAPLSSSSFSNKSDGLHGDIRDICFPDPSNPNLIYVATDGGVGKTINGDDPWTNITGNLALNESYSVAISEQEPETMLIGCQDNGTYKRYSDGTWKHVSGSDGGTCLISNDFSNDSIAFCTYGPGSPCSLRRSSDRGEYFSTVSSFHKHDSPLLQHPDSSNIYYKGLTYGDAQPVIMKSIDSGGNFDTLIKFNNAWGNVSAMGQSKSNPDYFYFATYDSYNSVDGFTPYFGALAPQDTSYKFGQIYLDNKYAKITEIDVSPTDESLIWLSVGNFLEGKKVFQSTDAGLTWSNISYNLDNIPVNNVEYDKNTETLFAGTDVGLFYLDEATNGTDTVWERYGDFPLVICSDIKINNATSQIIAATYGRGVWRADIGCNTTPGEVNVEVSTTFSEDKQFRNIVYIEDGGTLTLSNAEFKFIPDAQIIVQPGGKLIIDGAKLTSSCGEPWKGIIVLGDTTLSQQDDSYQGVVEVKNGAIIENALSAIFVGNPDNPGNNQSGGIVRIDSAVFRDNKACVEMTKYHNFAFNNPIYRISNKSYIINSTFETTDYLANQAINPYSYIALWEVEGINISRNTFTNLNPEAYTSTTKGKGIVSTSGGFYSYDNTFENLSYGIYATDPDLVSDISVTNNDFVDNNTGILIDAVDYITIHHNNFEIPDISWVYGIYAVDNTTTFIVEENNFTGQSNALSWGVYSTNNSATFNLYLNNFNDLFNGIYGSSSSSMKFECDSFQDNSTDVYISSNGASSNQGWRFEAAGNKFLGSCSSTSDIYSLMTIYYKYLPAATDPPSCVTSNVLLSTSNYENACASNFESSGGDEQKGIDELTALTLEITQKEALLLELTDGGNTPETVDDVATAEPEEALILRNNLLSKSPNLSDTVMHQSITVEDVLPSLMLTQILSSNPQAAKSDKVQNALDNRQNQLPQYMRDEIDKGKDTLSPKEELESEIEWLKSRKYRLFSQKLSDLELDTNQQDVIEMMLVEDNSLQSKYKLASFYLTNNNIAEASDVFDDIPQQFVLTPKEQVEYETMSLVFEIQLALKKSGKSYFDMDSLQKATIYELTEDTLHRAGSVARSIISLVDGVEYNYRGYIPLYEEEVFKTEQQQNSIFKFNLFPNPANDYFIVDYDFVTFDFKNASFNLQNTGNKIIYSEKLENKAYQFLVETESIRPGFYIGKLYENGKEVSSQGIVIKQDQLSVQEKADAEKLLADFEKETNKTMIVYPNPAGDYVFVNLFSTPQGTKQLLQITDNTGRVIISENISENTPDIKLNASGLATGAYTVNFIVDGAVIASETLVVE